MNQEDGSAGVMALVIMTLLLVLGGAFITLSSTEVDISRDYRNGIAAQYLAEAGVQWAIVKLKKEYDFVTAPGNSFKSQLKNSGTATAGTFVVEVTGSGNTSTIKSTGIAGNNEKTAARRMVVLKAAPLGVYSFPVYSDTSVSVHDNGKILMGPAGSKGTISVAGMGYVQGGTQSQLINFIFPSNNDIDYNGSSPLPQTIGSGETFAGLTGVYCVNGDFTIDGNLTTAANSFADIYVKGKVTINDDARISGKLRIISAKEIEVYGYVNSAILVACGTGYSFIDDSANMYGSIISRGNLIINGTVTYDKGVIQDFLPYVGATFTINTYSHY